MNSALVGSGQWYSDRCNYSGPEGPDRSWQERSCSWQDWSNRNSVGRGWCVSGNVFVDVLDVGDVTGDVVGDVVGDDLSSAVGKVDVVFAVGRVTVSGLLVPEVGSAMEGVNLDSVVELVDWRCVGVDRSGGIWNWKFRKGTKYFGKVPKKSFDNTSGSSKLRIDLRNT